MKGLNLWVCFIFCISAIIFLELIPTTKAQQSSSFEQKILLQIQKKLEYPNTLNSWQNWTDFCYIQPTSTITILCSNGHVTQLTLIGNKSSPFTSLHPVFSTNTTTYSQSTLSRNFDIDSLFTLLTKLTKLQKLSLVSLGIWGVLPSKIDRFKSLEMLNVSSNFIYGEIPKEVSYIKSLKSIVLSDNLINGSVPNLITLNNLEEIDLSNNQIGPKFPTFGINLVSIILRNNSIRSSIPSQIRNFNQLQKFDVSSNNLVGPIPSFVFNLPTLWYLNLADNKLMGELAMSIECGKRLWYVDISRNLLTGNLPKCIGTGFSEYRKVFSDWNCLFGSRFQHPKRFCLRQAFAVIPPKKKSNVLEGKQRVSDGVKLGIVFGVIGGVILVFGTICSLIWVVFSKRKIDENRSNKYDKSVGSKLPVNSLPVVETSKYVARSMRMPSTGLPSYHSFTIEELREATNNFDQGNLVTDGSQTQVYRGVLPSGSEVVIKCIKLQEKISSKTLKQNMELISQLRHQNLVSVLGHCVVSCQERTKGRTIYVVFEHVVNGSLREHLIDWKTKDRLKWPQRMTISMGIARGVHFLHTGIAPGIFGNDLKMDNILLDESLTPKVSDYKIPLPFKAEKSSNENNTSCSEDIYKLGVIMLELLTGTQITSQNQVDDIKEQLESSLVESPSALQKVIDLAMKGTFAYQSVKTAAQITVNCLCEDPSRRPPMEDVVWHLEYSIQAQQAWTTSGNLALNSGNISLLKS